MAKRVAMIVPGGIGKPDSIYVIPALQELIERLSNEFEIEVFCVGSYGNISEEYFMGRAHIHYIHREQHVRSLSAWKPLLLLRHILRRHTDNPFDLIHGISALPSGLLAVTIGFLLHISSVLSLQGGEAAAIPEIQYGNMLKLQDRIMTTFAIQYADEVTALTHYQVEQLAMMGVQREIKQIIPYGVDLQRFRLISQKNLDPPYHILHVANLTEVKDQITLIRAIKLLADKVDCILRIVGHDYLNGKLQKFVAELGLSAKTEFMGYVFPGKMPEHYNWAHILLQTSLYEGQGVVCVEAIASGVPVLGTNVGILSDLKGNGITTVNISDYYSLYQKILKLLSKPEQYFLCQQNSLLWAQQHSIDWTVQKFTEIYKELMEI